MRPCCLRILRYFPYTSVYSTSICVWHVEMERNALQMTLALTAGLSCGVVIGLLFASRRRRVRLPQLPRAEESDMLDSVSGQYKMVFVVRNDLKMGKGKVAAQCAHAAVGAYKQMIEADIELLRRWEEYGQMKVVVKAPEEQSFLKAAADAGRLGLNTHIVRDAGRTQIAPGSKTVLCIGPGPCELMDSVTGEFKLY